MPIVSETTRLATVLREILNRGFAALGRRLGQLAGVPSAKRTADRLVAEGARAESEGRLQDACAHYRAAAEAAPEHAAAHLNLGAVLEVLGDTEGALRSYQGARALAPDDAHAAYNAGRLLYARGELPEAERLLRAALDRKPDFPEANLTLAHIRGAQGDIAGAAAALEAALRQRPDYLIALHAYASILEKLGKAAEAAANFEKAFALESDLPELNSDLGKLLRERGRPAEAERRQRRAIALRADFPEAHLHLGHALWDQGRVEESLACYRRAIELRPDFAEAHSGVGNALASDRTRLDEAIACYRRAIELGPGLTDAHYNLGNALFYQNRHAEALECYRKVLALDPGHAQARWMLAIAQLPMVYGPGEDPARCRAAFAAQLEELDRWFDSSRLAQGFAAVGAHQPFCLAYQEENNRELLRRYGALCARLTGAWFEREGFAAPQRRARRAPLRVGVVSQYFWNHSVWNAIVKGWFCDLDPGRFALHAFYLGARDDEETKIARSRAAHFEQEARGPRQWVETILRQQLDVLLYPEIGMDPVTLKLASLRLAPVQVATWGHPETSGLPTIDYYLSAEDMEPPGAQDNYVERLVMLPHLGCSYRARRIEPAPIDPARFGIEPDVPLLVSPGAPFKYAPRHDWIYAEIARRLQRCRFVFFTPHARGMNEKLRERLKDAFARSGLDIERFVSFVPWLPRPAFYGLMQRADVFLDTIGFSGFNTAMEAIECALPVVAREGRFLRGRLASGILGRTGLPELVARTDEDYIALAVRLCRDAAWRAQMRTRIASGRAALFEDAAPIRALEDFLAHAEAPQDMVSRS